MTIHEFGQNHDEVIVLVHPSAVMWDYFEYVIPLLRERYHLIVPALPGYDTESDSDFTGVEQIAEEKDRKGDIAYIKKNLPQTILAVFEDVGHGGLAALKPDLLAEELTRVVGRDNG